MKKISLKKISFSTIQRKSLFIWIRHYKLVFVLSFIGLTAFASYQWYKDLYRYSWRPEEKRAYLDSTAKETAFQEKKFVQILERLESDRVRHGESLPEKKNIFLGAKKKNQ